MRRVIVAAVLVAFGADAAMADAPPPEMRPPVIKKKAVKRAPPPRAYPPEALPLQPIQRWTGPSAGGNIGGGWAFSNSSFSVGGAPFATAVNSLGGLNGGLQLGHNWQADRTVFGFETDIQITSQDGGLDAPPCPALICGVATTASFREKLAWFGTVRGRLGYASDFW